jgi:hypothetical protein
MRALPLLLACAAVAACSDYGFTPETEVDGPDPDDTGGTGDGDPDPIDEECPERTFPGFDAPVNEDCRNELAVGAFNPVVEWRKRSWSVESGSHWIMSAPIVVQLTDDNGDGRIDNDDIPDIVAVTFTGRTMLRAVSGADGRELWSTLTNLQITGSPAAADLDGDGLIDIVGVTGSGIEVFSNTGALKFARSGVLSGAISGTSDCVSISDMDGDGRPEIIVGRAILDSDGNRVGLGSHGMAGVQAFGNVGTTSFAVDIDGDGQQEVVVGNALYRRDGSTIWHNGQGDGYPAVGDFDGDGIPEIAVSGNGRLRLQDATGRVRWDLQIPGASTAYFGGPPTIADFDGDGLPEIGVASGSRYSVFNGDGTIVWQAVTDDSSSGNTGSTVFDFEGDGAAEVVYADQTRLWVFNGADGRVKLSWDEHSNGTWLEYPLVADVDGDGVAEIVVVHTPPYGSTTGLTVIGDRDASWRRGYPIWNQHAFHITNIDEDGAVPRVARRNWLTYNNFRSSDMSANAGLDAPDLRLAPAGVCELDCDENRLLVYVHVGNEGATTAGRPVVTAVAREAGVDFNLGQRAYPDVQPGTYFGADLWVIEGLIWPDVESITFRVTGDNQDCDESNNVLVLDGPFCGG